jgi:cytochrome c biogenesis protein CcdA
MTLPLLITLYVGFTHAFETDHLLAVGNMVTQRNSIKLSLKDGMYWGLGHTTTILLIGLLALIFRVNLPETYFKYFEATVGLMLVALGIYRLWLFFKNKKARIHNHLHPHSHPHKLAYGVGLVHGLAGSGALVLLVMAQIKEPLSGMLYLLLFGLGSIVGMLLAAGLFSFPFSKKIMDLRILQIILALASGMLCILYGAWVMGKNLW